MLFTFAPNTAEPNPPRHPQFQTQKDYNLLLLQEADQVDQQTKQRIQKTFYNHPSRNSPPLLDLLITALIKFNYAQSQTTHKRFRKAIN